MTIPAMHGDVIAHCTGRSDCALHKFQKCMGRTTCCTRSGGAQRGHHCALHNDCWCTEEHDDALSKCRDPSNTGQCWCNVQEAVVHHALHKGPRCTRERLCVVHGLVVHRGGVTVHCTRTYIARGSDCIARGLGHAHTHAPLHHPTCPPHTQHCALPPIFPPEQRVLHLLVRLLVLRQGGFWGSLQVVFCFKVVNLPLSLCCV